MIFTIIFLDYSVVVDVIPFPTSVTITWIEGICGGSNITVIYSLCTKEEESVQSKKYGKVNGSNITIDNLESNTCYNFNITTPCLKVNESCTLVTTTATTLEETTISHISSHSSQLFGSSIFKTYFTLSHYDSSTKVSEIYQEKVATIQSPSVIREPFITISSIRKQYASPSALFSRRDLYDYRESSSPYINHYFTNTENVPTG